MTRRIYTRTGDTGETGLFGRGRVSKASPRVEAYGEVDELNAAIGWAAASASDERIAKLLTSLQADLFAIGAHLAAPGRTAGLPDLPADRAAEMESWIDAAEAELPELRSFILPGGSNSGAALHVARTVCRRAERRVVALAEAEAVDPAILVYLNRLSDLLFTAARLANHRAGEPETRWEPRAR
jgi:cob(I)alamin adenosyltransferase